MNRNRSNDSGVVEASDASLIRRESWLKGTLRRNAWLLLAIATLGIAYLGSQAAP